MKPKIGQTVWILTYERSWQEWYIIPESVFALGKSSFVFDDYAVKQLSMLQYSDYGNIWFASLNAAKAYANKISGKRLKWSISSDGTSYYGSKHEIIS